MRTAPSLLFGVWCATRPVTALTRIRQESRLAQDCPARSSATSFSGSQANCVEIAARDRVLVRDTKNKPGAVLRFSPAAWRRFAD
jgi:hypothetical protein